MPVSEMLKSFREGGYGKKPDENGDSEEMSGGMRTIKLTDSELKELQAYASSEGGEQECLVTGRLGPDNSFSVTSVRNPEGSTMPDQDQMAQEMMNKMDNAPVRQGQTMPSPS
jgi:hypothetical protein